jgi:DNA-binding PadR family transcriptional regulator
MFGGYYRHFEKSDRLFEKGDMKYVILDLINEKPMHGYEIIRELEKRSYGCYTPSAGSVYPTLQLLEDRDFVKAEEQDSKKVYTITEEGRRFLRERRDTMDKIREHMQGWWGFKSHREFYDIIDKIIDLTDIIRQEAGRIGPEKIGIIKDIITKATRDIEEVIRR